MGVSLAYHMNQHFFLPSAQAGEFRARRAVEPVGPRRARRAHGARWRSEGLFLGLPIFLAYFSGLIFREYPHQNVASYGTNVPSF